MEKERADNTGLNWEDGGTPVSQRFQDPYYSKRDGRAEAEYVFIRGNQIHERLIQKPIFRIAELGFGTGLNFFQTLCAREALGHSAVLLEFSSFERYPLARQDVEKALGRWPEILAIAQPWLEQIPQAEGFHRIEIGPTSLELFIGDANLCICELSRPVDAWYLDGFSPDKNPDLWSEAILKEVAERTVEGGTFATYTAAGWVRRRLKECGFEVRRQKGFGTKRHMSVGWKTSAAIV